MRGARALSNINDRCQNTTPDTECERYGDAAGPWHSDSAVGLAAAAAATRRAAATHRLPGVLPRRDDKI
eukprot:195277-Hanusia_phi.AAC.1